MPINDLTNPSELINGIDTANANPVVKAEKVVVTGTNETVTEALGGKEDDLGNPSSDGHVLSSTAAGVRSWVDKEGDLGNPSSDGQVLSSTAAGVRSWVDKENDLGNPSSDGQVLSSTAAGVRSWTAPGSDTDGAAIHDNVSGEINAITAKTSAVNADIVLIEDSADSFNKKKIEVGDLFGTELDQATSDIAAIESGLERTDVVFFSNSGDDTGSGVAIDKPVATLTRVNTISDGLTITDGATHQCDDGSSFNFSYDGRSNFDLWAPQATFTGLRPVSDTLIVAKNIVTSAQEIVMPANVDVQLERIENGTTGAQIQWLGEAHNSTKLIINDANFNTTTPMTFASGFNGYVHVEINNSNLTDDPFRTVRNNDDLYLTGYLTLTNGTTIYYGNTPFSQDYMTVVDADYTVTFRHPTVAVKVTDTNRIVTLPNPTSALSDNSVFRINVKNLGNIDAAISSGNLSDAATSNVVNVQIGGTDNIFIEGLASVAIKFGEEITFSLIKIGNLRAWTIKDALQFEATIFDNEAELSGASNYDMALQINDTNDVLNSLWEVDSVNTSQLNIKAPCRISFNFVRISARYSGSPTTDIQEISIFVRKNNSDTDRINFVTPLPRFYGSNTPFELTPQTRTMDLSAGDYIEFRLDVDSTLIRTDFFRAGISTTI